MAGMIPFAHIAGIPVEETLAAFGPVLGVTLGALGATLRLRGRGLRRGYLRDRAGKRQ